MLASSNFPLQLLCHTQLTLTGNRVATYSIYFMSSSLYIVLTVLSDNSLFVLFFRWLYWTDVGLDTIERASMDGTSRTVLHSTGMSYPYGLTIDYENQILYWSDYSYDRVESSYVNGTGRVVLTTSSISSPQDIAYFGGSVYWTDRGYDRIYSASVDPVTVATVSSSFTNPYGISVFSEEGQPEGV